MRRVTADAGAVVLSVAMLLQTGFPVSVGADHEGTSVTVDGVRLVVPHPDVLACVHEHRQVVLGAVHVLQRLTGR